MEERRVIHEITPLMGKDVLYIADRRKKEFTYPIHNHEVFELNFVEHAPGVRRIVGDSNEVIGEYDLVLITSPDLEHVWEQNTCTSEDIREVTVQFDFGMGEDSLFGRNPFISVRKMMNEARKGLCFPLSAIMKVYKEIDTLSTVGDGFYAVVQFMTILYELSKCEGARTLASSSFAKIAVEDDSRRILKVKNFINENFMDEIRLAQLSEIAGMSPSAFSRFFKLHTGRNLSEYIIDIRLGYAARKLVDTSRSISEISFECGFNNLLLPLVIPLHIFSHLDSRLGLAEKRIHLGADLICGFIGIEGKLSDLLRHNGESAACFTRSRGLNGGIQRKQISL